MASASPFVLTDVDARVHAFNPSASAEPVLLVFVERDCPTSAGALAALADTGGRVLVISEGTVGAARDLARRAGAGALPVLVESDPYPVSTAYRLRTVPTFVLVADGAERGREEGWDRDGVAALLAEAGGDVHRLRPVLPPQKPGCASRNSYDDATRRGIADADAALSADDGVEEMWRRGWTDGLPVVPPTPGRVAAMLDGRDGAHVLGEVPPVNARLTRERLAACAVLAGCTPPMFGVVEAAAEAVLDPAFNLHGIQNTTHFAAPCVIVNGPVRRALGMNAGSNALGFGSRANATIGRALRLMLCLTGGGTPGGLDQSTLGGPHKWTFCFPEHEEASPWAPLHVDLGYGADESVVTVVCGEGPAGVSDHYSQTPEALANTLTLAMERVWSPAWYPVGAETVLLLCPEHAATFGAAGWSKERLREWIFTRARRTVAELRALGTGELTPFVTAAENGATEVGKFTRPEEIVVVVTGGVAGRFSAVVGPWVGFGLGSQAVSRRVNG